MTNALRQPGNHSCHRKAPSVRAGSQRPAAAGAALRAGNLIISAVRAGAPGSTAALSSVLEELPAHGAVREEAPPAKGGFTGRQAWRLTFTSLQSTLLVPKLCLGPARVHRWCLYSCSSFFIPWAPKQCDVQIMRKREKEKEREGRRQGRGEREQKRGRKGGREEGTERKKILDWPERVQGCPKEASV